MTSERLAASEWLESSPLPIRLVVLVLEVMRKLEEADFLLRNSESGTNARLVSPLFRNAPKKGYGEKGLGS